MTRDNPVGKLLALELAPMLPQWWERHPDGLTIKGLARLSGLNYDRCHAAFLQLEVLGHGHILHRPDRSVLYLVPLDYEPPAAWDLTAKQRGVVEWMATQIDADGMVRASVRDICRGAPLSKGGIMAVLDSLDRKGYLEIVERGRGVVASLYRLWPNGDGPRGFSAFRTAGRA